MTKKKKARRKTYSAGGKKVERICVTVPRVDLGRMDSIAEYLGITRSAAISEAARRWCEAKTRLIRERIKTREFTRGEKGGPRPGRHFQDTSYLD